MGQIYVKLWRVFLVTVFLFVTVGCAVKDLSHNPEAVDSITTQYIYTELSADYPRFDTTVVCVDRVKMTRQDNIPVALVDIIRTDSTTVREFIHFDYETISRVRDVMESEESVSTAQIANSLSISELNAQLYRQIVLRAKGRIAVGH
ncbi:MAG: hypothetical protein II262_03020 [Alistipes sp.]|nr:hypothetical protein [Alistipes sp.]